MRQHAVQLVAITFDDGSVGIMQFVLDPRVPDPTGMAGWDPQTRLRFPTSEAVDQEISKSAWGDLRPVSWRFVASGDLPNSRDYRNAWKDDGRTIVHDMPKAREIHRAKLRRERAPQLAELDVEYQRADEAGDNEAKRRVARRKQGLRDVTADPRIEAAQTIADLNSIGLPTKE